MSDTQMIDVDEQLKKLLKLSAAQRIELAERLIESVPPFADEETELAWKEEIARRVEEVDQGRVKLISAEDVHTRIERKLKDMAE